MFSPVKFLDQKLTAEQAQDSFCHIRFQNHSLMPGGSFNEVLSFAKEPSMGAKAAQGQCSQAFFHGKDKQKRAGLFLHIFFCIPLIAKIL